MFRFTETPPAARRPSADAPLVVLSANAEALNALGALFVVGPLVAAWLFRPALGPTGGARGRRGLDVLTAAFDRPWRKDRTNE